MTFTSGNNLTLTIPSVGTGDIAVFAVWRQTTANTQHNVFSIGTPGGGTETALGWNNGEGRYKFYRFSGSQSVNTAATNNVNVIGSALQVSGLRTLHINGVAPSGTGTESYNQTNTTAFIGGGTFPLVGQLAEVIFYIGTVTTAQQQQIEGYLAHKWGLVPPSPTIPLTVPGLALWLDASDTSSMTLSGSSVTGWADKSGNNRNATSSGSPTLSSGQIVFSGSQLFSGSITNTTANLTAFVVAKTTTSPATQFARILSASAGGNDFDNTPSMDVMVYLDTANTLGSFRNFVTLSTVTTTPNQTFLAVTRTNATTNTFYLNGTASSTVTLSGGAVGSFGYTTYWVGSGPTGANLTGTVSEVLYYHADLTDTQRQTIENYLAKKWGIGASTIPSSHPFYSIRPHLRGFQPNDIDGCLLWLDGNDVSVLFSDVAGTSAITTNGQTIRCWKDKSGRGCNATQAGNAPIWNSSNYVNFTQSLGQFMNLPNGTLPFASGTNAYSIFAVANLNNTANVGKTIIGNGVAGNNSFNALQIQGQSIANLWYNNDIAGGSLTANTFFIANIAFNGSTRYIYQTGTSVNTTASSGWAAPNTNNVIGVEPATGNWYYDGNIGEILVYNTALTTSQRQQVEGYLAHKWGLTTPIPSTHPFKSITPASLPFSPRNISGVALWLDAADTSSMTLSGSSVTQWRDKSGNGYVMTNNGGTTTIATASLNSLTTVYTPSGTNTRITNFVGRTKCTIFLVGKAASSRYLLALNGGFLYTANDSLLYFSPPTGDYLDLVDSVSGSIVSNNTWFILCIGYDNATNSTANPYTINGTTRSTAITPRGTPGILTDQNITSTLYINSVNGTNSYDSVYTAEILYYNDTLTTTQRQQVEGYLAQKWGLTGSLPSSHPFKKLPA